MSDEYDLGLGGGKSSPADQAVHQGAKKAGEEAGKAVAKEVGKTAAKEGTKAAAHGASQAAGSAAPVVGNLVAAVVVEAIDNLWKYRKPVAILLFGALLLASSPLLFIGGAMAQAMHVVEKLGIKPVAGIAFAAYSASTECDFAGPSDPGHIAAALSTTYLVAMAFEATGDGKGVLGAQGVAQGSVFFGSYRNPLADSHAFNYDAMYNTGAVGNSPPLNLNTVGLAAGGDTTALLNLNGGKGINPQDWTTLQPLTGGEHGVGFLLITPSDWRNDLSQSAMPASVDKTKLSPWRPQDAFLVVACHLKWQVNQFLAAGQAADKAVTNAIVSFGNTVAQIYELVIGLVSQIKNDLTNPTQLALDLAALATSLVAQFTHNGHVYFDYLQGFLSGHLLGTGANGIAIAGGSCLPNGCPSDGLLGYTPVGIPGTPGGPVFVAGSGYDAYAMGIILLDFKNQCTYGAVAEWLTIHQNDPAWKPSLIASQQPLRAAEAGLMFATAQAAGYTVSNGPVTGAMVVYKQYYFGANFPAGHIATVVGVSPDGKHYRILEQNYITPADLVYPPAWNPGGFDLRTVSWPDPGVAGFIWGPPGTKIG